MGALDGRVAFITGGALLSPTVSSPADTTFRRDRAANFLDAVPDNSGVVVQVVTRAAPIGNAGQFYGLHFPAAYCQLRLNPFPTPRAKPGAVH